MIISSSDNTLIASKGENSDFLSYEKYHRISLEGGTLPLKVDSDLAILKGRPMHDIKMTA